MRVLTKAATIASGASTSDAIRMDTAEYIGLLLPAEFDGTAVTFTACDTATGTFVPVYDSDGNPVSATVAAGQAVGLSAAERDALAPWPFVKLVSGASESAARTVKVVMKE